MYFVKQTHSATLARSLRRLFHAQVYVFVLFLLELYFSVDVRVHKTDRTLFDTYDFYFPPCILGLGVGMDVFNVVV
jgi:hypothetical protein